MKISTFTCLLLALCSVVVVNAQILYGLQNNSSTNAFDIVSIDPFTGNSTILFSTVDMTAVAANATTFDHFNTRYISWGIDNTSQSRLYVADIDSGVVTNQPLLNAMPIEMEYDLKFQKAYGLWYDNAQSLQHFVEIDLTNGSISTVVTLPNVQFIALNHSTYNSNSGYYIFSGIETNGQQKLITIDALNGSVVSSVPFNQSGYGASALEYNVINNKLYGITTQTDSSYYDPLFGYGFAMYLTEIDMMTGNNTIVNPTPFNSGLWAGYMVGGIAFDQQTQTYIVVCVNDSSSYLKMIDATTGIVYSSADLANSNNGNFLEIQADHFSFAESYYVEPVNTQNILKVIEGKIFPNPTSDFLNIEVAYDIERLEIFDLKGQLVLEQQDLQYNQISIAQLPKGTYLLVVRTAAGIFKEKLVKF